MPGGRRCAERTLRFRSVAERRAGPMLGPMRGSQNRLFLLAVLSLGAAGVACGSVELVDDGGAGVAENEPLDPTGGSPPTIPVVTTDGGAGAAGGGAAGTSGAAGTRGIVVGAAGTSGTPAGGAAGT